MESILTSCKALKSHKAFIEVSSTPSRPLGMRSEKGRKEKINKKN
jgi:hypothetical protein